MTPYIETLEDGYRLTIDRQEALSKGISTAAYNSVAAHLELLNSNIRRTLDAGGTVCFGTPCTEEELAFWKNKIEEYENLPIVTRPLQLTKGEPWDEWGSLIGSDTGPDKDGYVGYLPLTFAESGQKIKVAEPTYRTMIVTITINQEDIEKEGWQVNMDIQNSMTGQGTNLWGCSPNTSLSKKQITFSHTFTKIDNDDWKINLNFVSPIGCTPTATISVAVKP